MAMPGEDRPWDANSLQLDFFNFLHPTRPPNALSTIPDPSTPSAASESKPSQMKAPLKSAAREERPRPTVKAYLQNLMLSSTR